MNSPATSWKLNIPALAAFAAAIAGGAIAFTKKADTSELIPIQSQVTMLAQHKADKTDLDPMREQVIMLAQKEAVGRNTLETIQKRLDKLDSNIERVVNNQDWQIQQEVKRRQWDQIPPSVTPSPTPNVNR